MCSWECHTVKDMETGIPVVTAVDFMPPLNILYSSQTFIWISQLHKSPDSKHNCRHLASLKSVTYIYYKRVATGSLGHWVTGHRFRPGHGRASLLHHNSAHQRTDFTVFILHVYGSLWRWKYWSVRSGVTIGWTGWTMSRGPRVPGAPEFQTKKKYIFGITVQIWFNSLFIFRFNTRRRGLCGYSVHVTQYPNPSPKIPRESQHYFY